MPENAAYMVTAYIITAAIIVGYAVLLYRRTLKP